MPAGPRPWRRSWGSGWTSWPSPPRWPSRGRWRVLSGAVTAEQLDSNVAAEEIMLPPGVLDELASLAEPPAEYWAARSRRPWA